MATKLYYDADKNPNEAANFPGVPLRDISDEEYEGYPDWLQRSIEASPMYRKTNPNPEPRKATPQGATGRAEGAQEGRSPANSAGGRTAAGSRQAATTDGQQAAEKPGETTAGEEK